MGNKFDFYEIVKVVSSEKIYSDIYGFEGVVLGMSKNDDGFWGYAVFVNNDTWSLDEKALSATGRFSSRENFYSDKDTVKVVVDQSGKDSIVKY